MKNFMKSFMIVAAAAALTACNSVNSSGIADLAPTQPHPAKFKPTYEVENQRISASATAHSLFYFFRWGVTRTADFANIGGTSFTSGLEGMAKAGAVFNACHGADCGKCSTCNCDRKTCDAVLGANYMIETTDYLLYKKVKATVKGYPAHLKGVKEVGIVPANNK